MKKQPPKKKSIGTRIIRIAAKTVLFILLFFILLIILIQLPPVQNFIKNKAVTWLEKKLDTKVAVGKVYIGFPKNIVLEKIYVEDRQQDTLLYGGKIKVNLNLFRLIFNNDIDFKNIELDDITAKVKREWPDTTFNYQFIIDAFASGGQQADTGIATSSTPLTIQKVTLNNIRVLYKDVVTGNDAEAWLGHFDTKIDRFDLDKMDFAVPAMNIEGLTGRLYQSKPLVNAPPATEASSKTGETTSLKLAIGTIDLGKIKFDYRNEVEATYANLDLGKLHVKSRKLDLDSKTIELDNVTLAHTVAAIRLGPGQEVQPLPNKTEPSTVQEEPGWRIKAAAVLLEGNNLQFDDDKEPRQKTGMDYAHLKAGALDLEVNDFLFSNDSVAGHILSASLNEQSGFVLNALRTHFLYTNKQAYLQDLYLQTPGTELKRKAAIHYTSIASLQNDIGTMQVDLDINESKVLVKDILTFVPSLREQPAFANPNTTWYINSRITGKVSDLQLATLQVRGLNDTRIDISGRITGLPEAEKAYANLSIRTLSSSRRDIEMFVPASQLPQGISLPDRMTLTGNIKGSAEQMDAAIALATDLGDAAVNGTVSHITDSVNARYDVVVETKAVDLRTILQDSLYGPVTATFNAKGKGYTLQTADADLQGVIHAAVYKGYTYHDFTFDSKIADQQAALRAGINDPNIDFTLHALADLSKDYPAVKMEAVIDSLKMQPLHLAADAAIYRGKIEADFGNTNPDSLQGNLYLTQLLMVRQDKRLQLDTVQLSAGVDDTIGRFIHLNSDVASAAIEGQYKISELGSIFQKAIQPYFAVASADSINVSSPYDFTLKLHVQDNPALQVFVPGLERLDSVVLNSHFADSGWMAVLKAPAIDMGTTHIRNLNVDAGTNAAGDAVNVKATVENINSGSSVALINTTLDAKLSQNTIGYALNIQDRAAKDRYHIEGTVNQPEQGNYIISLYPDNLLLNYNQWVVAQGNRLTLATGIHADSFILSRNGQQLSIHSLSGEADAPMEVAFTDFRLATLTGFVQPDSTLADGLLNGKITFTELDKEPVFTGDLTIRDLSINRDTAGNVRLRADNKAANTYAIDLVLDGRGNDVTLKGNYYVALVNNNSFDFDLAINKLPLTTVEAFSSGAIRHATGSVNGKFNLTGTVDKPMVNGDLNFDQAGFNFSMLNSYFRIDKEKIAVNREGIRFNRFQVRDSVNNALTIDGTAATSDFRNYTFDMDVRANNFRALNSTKKDNDLFYGQLYFTTNLKVTGTDKAPAIDGRLAVNEKTNMTIVLPQNDPGVVDREGVVVFIDKDAPVNDSLFLASYDSLNTSGFTGMDISVNVEVDKAAEFTLVVDQGNGDFLNVKGEALLNCGIDPGGKVTLTGSYEIEEGAYELTFNFLKRKFGIQKGSRIVWEGEPTAATVDITAAYVANAAPLDLVKNQLPDVTGNQRNMYLQKLPFNVKLKMEGPLLQPLISFDIDLPSDKSYAVSNDVLTTVRTKLGQLRQEEGEMNKQVFSLLLLNRFLAEDPFSSSAGGPSAGTLARQSVSKLLTEQLNRLADDLVKGVDLDFDVVSSEDYTTGQRRDRTDLNVGVSKQLFNDRLTVSIGSNFELEGPQNTNQQAANIAGNVALDYRLSKDNRYMLRAYRKNEYQGIIEGYVVETGLSFIITVDYNRFRDIFLSEEKRRERRMQRRQERQQQKAVKAGNDQKENTTNE